MKIFDFENSSYTSCVTSEQFLLLEFVKIEDFVKKKISWMEHGYVYIQ
jgi:hypothetical protein